MCSSDLPGLHDSTGDRAIPESSIIIEYLAQHYPGTTDLVPRDTDLARQVRLDDRFYDEGALDDDAALREVLGAGTPVTSSTPAFLHHRPSQMPEANGHSRGNANRVKADVLFEFLRADVLPALLQVPR